MTVRFLATDGTKGLGRMIEGPCSCDSRRRTIVSGVDCREKLDFPHDVAVFRRRPATKCDATVYTKSPLSR